MNAIAIIPPESVEGEVVGNGFFLEENPFRTGKLRYVEVGDDEVTLDDYAAAAARQLPDGYGKYLQVWLGEHRVDPTKWAVIRPKPGAPVYIRVRPQGHGAKNILRAVLMIALVAAAVYFLGPLAFQAGGILGLSLPAGAAAAASAAAIGIVTVAGSLLINALIPPPGLTNQQGNRDPRYQLTGTNNRFAPYAPIPYVCGKVKVFPLVAARPYTENVGKNQYLRMLLIVGWGPIKVSDIRIGNTPITAFRNVSYEVTEGGPAGWGGNRTLTLYNRRVTEQQLSIELLYNVPGAFQTTPFDTVEIGVDIIFPFGLIQYEADGDQVTETVRHKIEYRVAGSNGAWLAAPIIDTDDIVTMGGGIFSVTEKTPDQLRHTVRWTVNQGRYEVRVTRIDVVRQTDPPDNDTHLDKSFWAALRCYTTDAPVVQDNVCMIAIRMQASEQLNGVPDTISCIAEAYKPVYSGGNWNTYQLTQSPAWAFADVLRRRAGMADSRVDAAAISAWNTDCAATAPNAAEPRWTFNGVIEGGSIYEALRQIASIGRAMYTLRDGKHSVVQDKAQSTPVQHFTPANSWGYSGTRSFIDQPHAFKVEFQNKDFDYQTDERVVYSDGYNAANATKFEVLQLFGATSSTLVFREARYHMAVGILRPEEHRINVDIENLRCTLGDRVQLTHDVIAVGKGFGRIKSLVTSGANTIGFVLDGDVEFEVGFTYQLRVRESDGTTSIRTVTAAGTGMFDTISCSAEATAGGPQPGDLFMFGVTGLESMPCIVKRIEPGADLTAVLTLASYNAAIYTADTGTIPPFNSYLTASDFRTTAPNPPQVTCRSDATAMQGTQLRLAVDITAAPSSGIPIVGYEVRYRLKGSTSWTQYGGLHAGGNTLTVFITPVSVGQTYQVAARAKGGNGLFSDWAQAADHVVVGNTQNGLLPPTNATITLQPTGNLIKWTNPVALDLKAVEVWANTVNNFAGAVMLGETLSGQFLHSPLSAGDVRHYWLRSKNTSGAVSAVLYVGSMIRPVSSLPGSGDGVVEPPAWPGGAGIGAPNSPTGGNALEGGWGLGGGFVQTSR